MLCARWDRLFAQIQVLALTKIASKLKNDVETT